MDVLEQMADFYPPAKLITIESLKPRQKKRGLAGVGMDMYRDGNFHAMRVIIYPSIHLSIYSSISIRLFIYPSI